MADIDELFERKRDLEERIANYFGDEEGHTGDRGYQELLNELEEVNDQIGQEYDGED